MPPPRGRSNVRATIRETRHETHGLIKRPPRVPILSTIACGCVLCCANIAALARCNPNQSAPLDALCTPSSELAPAQLQSTGLPALPTPHTWKPMALSLSSGRMLRPSKTKAGFCIES